MKSASCITKLPLLTEMNLLYDAVNFILNNRNQNRHKTTPKQSFGCYKHLSSQMSFETGFCPTPTTNEPFPYTENLIHAMNKFLRQPTCLAVVGCEDFATVTTKITIFYTFKPVVLKWPYISSEHFLSIHRAKEFKLTHASDSFLFCLLFYCEDGGGAFLRKAELYYSVIIITKLLVDPQST
jgi:hypothetical protein